MISKKKFLSAILAISIVAALAIGGTIAYLTATTDSITNTFTVGDIKIKLDEGKLLDDGVTLDTTERVTSNANKFKVVPGATQAKDPTVTVIAGSEACYVYACVENGLGDAVTININSDWTSVATSGNKTLYRYNSPVPAASTDTVLTAVFPSITYANGLDGNTYSALANKTIIVNAFAHQSQGVDQATADAAAKAQFSFT